MKNDSSIKFEGELVLLLIILTLFLGIAIAQPHLPHQFYGSVTCLSGQSVPDNTIVSAKIDNTIYYITTKQGTYGYIPVFLIEGNDNDLIEFFVNNNPSTTYLFDTGSITKIDLTAQSSVCQTQSGSDTGSGGGSSSGGGGFPTGLASLAKKIVEEQDKKGSGSTTDEDNQNKTQNGDTQQSSPPRIPTTIGLQISLISLFLLFVTLAVFLYEIKKSKKDHK